MAGDQPEQPHMARLRDYILSQGGAAKANVFTRIKSLSCATCMAHSKVRVLIMLL
jgi:hypothetical protein